MSNSGNVTAEEVLSILHKFVQWCRENGESDMRSVLGCIRGLQCDLREGKTAAQIHQELEEELEL